MPNIPLPEGLSFSDVRGVFLNFGPLPVMSIVGQDKADELYYGKTEKLKYAQGAVAEKSAHTTLLFGLHPRPDFDRAVRSVLNGWEPDNVTVDRVSFFPSNVEGEDYVVIIGLIRPTLNILQGNARLAVLDYTNNFPSYTPHVTFAYVKGSADFQSWISDLNVKYAGETLPVLSLDIGTTG